MSNITILQADNRPNLNYLLLTQQVNQKVCNHFDYKYLFITIDNNKYTDMHPATKKIYVANDFLNEANLKCKDTNDVNNANDDILVFLDSDAWIQNCFWLNEIIKKLQNNKVKHGCFSRDPYSKKNTFINSGSFILKINDYTRKMYREIMNSLENDETNSHYKNSWPYDQFYVSNYVFKHKEDFDIFVPDILNTPLGKVLRHNWHKTQRMYEDLHYLITSNVIDSDNTEFDLKKYIDEEVFPNTDENAYEYIV
jgi:hypothetical protein